MIDLAPSCCPWKNWWARDDLDHQQCEEALELRAPRKKSFLLALAAHKKNAFRQMLSATTPAKVKIDLQFI